MGIFNRSKKPSGGGLGRGVVRRPTDDGELMERERDVTSDANEIASINDDLVFPLDGATPVVDPVGSIEPENDTFPFTTTTPEPESSPESRAVVDEVTTGKGKKRRGLFGSARAGEASDKPAKGAKLDKPAAKEKAEKPKKAGRFGRKPKPQTDAEGRKVVVGQAGVERLSNRVIMDFLPGMAKEDAIETARHFALNHCQNPTNAFYTVMAIQDGYAYEVQEGVGRSYLSSVIDLATNNPNRLIVVPMLRRKMTIFYTPRAGVFEVSILDEGVDPPDIEGAEPIQAERGAAMKPVMKQYIHWLYTGAIAATIGGLALLGSLAFYAFDPQAKVPPEWRVTDVAQLPVMQWNKLTPDGSGSYVVRLEYTDNAWRVVRQNPNAVVNAFEVEDSGTADVAGGTAITAPTGDGVTPTPAPGAGPDIVQPAPAAPGALPPQ